MQELIFVLKTLTINPTKKLHMCMVDFTVMYTNINKDSYHNMLQHMFESLNADDGKVDVVLQAVNLANKHNYLELLQFL
jgi:hypothetical protein